MELRTVGAGVRLYDEGSVVAPECCTKKCETTGASLHGGIQPAWAFFHTAVHELDGPSLLLLLLLLQKSGCLVSSKYASMDLSYCARALINPLVVGCCCS
ncbi:hypothetical protein AMECASPLE_025196 [Ameca splendens]|uniref:Uncharacterized protein n=1 Tax=Ameca splendens TaxID=208324 RepID=A0ABV0XHI8_9TELE